MYGYPPGYVATASLLSFGAGMAVGAAVWGDCDWGSHDVHNNYYGGGGGGGNNQNVNTARFDYNLSSKQTLFARAIFLFDLGGGVSQLSDTASPSTWSHPYGIALGHTWTVSPTKVNRFVYGLTREAFTAKCPKLYQRVIQKHGQ